MSLNPPPASPSPDVLCNGPCATDASAAASAAVAGWGEVIASSSSSSVASVCDCSVKPCDRDSSVGVCCSEYVCASKQVHAHSRAQNGRAHQSAHAHIRASRMRMRASSATCPPMLLGAHTLPKSSHILPKPSHILPKSTHTLPKPSQTLPNPGHRHLSVHCRLKLLPCCCMPPFTPVYHSPHAPLPHTPEPPASAPRSSLASSSQQHLKSHAVFLVVALWQHWQNRLAKIKPRPLLLGTLHRGWVLGARNLLEEGARVDAVAISGVRQSSLRSSMNQCTRRVSRISPTRLNYRSINKSMHAAYG